MSAVGNIVNRVYSKAAGYQTYNQKSVTKKSGYAKEDVSAFMQQGGAQSVENVRGSKQIKAPEGKTRTDVRYLMDGRTIAQKTSGFKGEFAKGVTHDQLIVMEEAFTKRREELKSRAARPGRTGLFLSRV